MKPEEATAYTARCFRGEPASCSFACPFHLDVRSFVEKVGKGRWGPAYRAYRDAVTFPGVVAALCEQPCSKHCQRTVLGDEPIALRELEAACLRLAKDRKPESFFIPPKEQTVAVIGAGVGGLACALNLAQKKYAVTVFDKQPGWGGMLRSHPRFAEFDADIALQFSAVQVEFRFGHEVQSLAEVAGFAATYVATGSGGDSFGLLEGWDAWLLTTAVPGVFLGGMLGGGDALEAIAQGVEASKIMEVFLQTGKATRSPSVYEKKENCDRYLTHAGAAQAPLVVAASTDGYDAEEAKAEAARCFRCDCGSCIAGCEMLKKFRKDPHKIAVEVYTDMCVNPPFSSRTVTREVYSCNVCGHCRSVCPEDVDIGGLMQFSRAARLAAGVHPAALHDFWLREMDFATTEASFASAAPGKETCEYCSSPVANWGRRIPST
jgi:hypothetical protein